ncbi:heat-stable enterotoxin EAST1 [Escherichia coli]|uniref:heat-stable enterotoxin EAST1 n=1 Tax=Escherichia TaxID=561 RepID=UPI003CCB7BD2
MPSTQYIRRPASSYASCIWCATACASCHGRTTSSPRSVALMQLHFLSLAVVSSREDFHLQARAHAGRTHPPRPEGRGFLLRSGCRLNQLLACRSGHKLNLTNGIFTVLRAKRATHGSGMCFDW